MAVQVSYPGVYIEEFAPGSPIEGVGTSTAAFLGVASRGPMNEPTTITSWDGFIQKFGPDPLSGQYYLWYAVRGFFENGGSTCYVTRVSNAEFDKAILDDVTAQKTIRVWARESGELATKSKAISIEVADAHVVTGSAAKLFRHSMTGLSALKDATELVTTSADEAAKFRSGDAIRISDAANSEDAVVARVNGLTIQLQSGLSVAYNNATVRLADLKAGGKTLRVEGGAGLMSGSVLSLTQDPSGTKVEDTGLVVARVEAERVSTTLTTYRVELRDPGLKKAFDLSAKDVAVESHEFTIKVTQKRSPDDYKMKYDNLSMDPDHPRYYENVIKDDVNGVIYAVPVDPPNVTPVPGNRPKATPVTPSPQPIPLIGGKDDNPTTIQPDDYKKAIEKLARIDDINLLCVPDSQNIDVQTAMIAHCENLQDRFAILDSMRDAPMFDTGSVRKLHRPKVESAKGYAALYYPWVIVGAPSGKPIAVPPSGHVAGIMARVDANRGVFKAPAGTEATVSGALSVVQTMSDREQGILNLDGINVIRTFNGGRPTVWGARTTAKDDKNWQYVNIRRLFLFLEESIQDGIRWAVFEPNNYGLWQKLKLTISDFLNQQWRAGALFGATAKDAYFVRIDDALNPFSEQQLGRLHIEIGVRPSYPAEFIIVRIGIWAGGSEVSEG